jgi:hypothetical protein
MVVHGQGVDLYPHDTYFQSNPRHVDKFQNTQLE